MPRGVTYAVLKLVSMKVECGTDIHKRLCSHLNHPLPSSHVYIMLKRLQNKKYIDLYEINDKKKNYRITNSGLQALKENERLYG